MGYVKVVKNKSFYRRYQVKYRRRRQHKTNYRLRRGLIKQDKRKYNAPKWRFVVRISNRDVTCQVACARSAGDQVLCAAYSHELPKYGLKVGLTNYPACYCTGLLLARRLLTKIKLDKVYKGKKEIDGNLFQSRESNIQWKGGKIYRPFKCILDVGLARTTRGARIFGALKGAVDGGLDIPHRPVRFPGFKSKRNPKHEVEEDSYTASDHAAQIFGGKIAGYMRELQEKDGDKYNKQFRSYIANDIKADDLEELYENVHEAIRKDPRAPPKKKRDLSKMVQKPRLKKLTLEERKQRRQERILQLQRQAQDARNNDIVMTQIEEKDEEEEEEDDDDN